MADHLIDLWEAELDRWEKETGEHRDSYPADFDEFCEGVWYQEYVGDWESEGGSGREKD